MKVSPCCGSDHVTSKLVGDEVWEWCQECGRQVQAIETVCPICGIDLYDAVIRRVAKMNDGEDVMAEHAELFHGE